MSEFLIVQGLFINTETQERRIDVPIVIKAKKDIADLQKVKEDLAAWLVTKQPSELIFDDELDRTYLALIDGSFDAEELVNRGKGIITFICAMPYKLGPNRKIDLKLEGSRLITNILNNGSEYSDPKFTIKVENPSTFIDISRKRKKKHNIFVWDTLFLWKNEQSRKSDLLCMMK